MKIVIHNLDNYDIKNIKKQLLDLFKTINNKKNMQLIFCSEEYIKTLNSTYRNKDYVTDVLSFESDDRYSLGDIFICYNKAITQAQEYNHSSLREISFLAVHGYLHLIGYDHENEIDTKIMEDLQNKILEDANILRS
ncbi:MAG: rRNA maturation RNase YbeY [Acholeplasmatales bacterium]|jgi:probable rRNA maturation factor|nr:rRNA maturation RNase YbeY [Acholeplasmatales bacterium]